MPRMKETREIVPNTTEILTKPELAKRLKCSTRKIEQDAGLPKLVWGRSVRYDWHSVLDYLKGKGGEK